MAKKTYTPKQIINKLREAEVHLSQGITTGEASRNMANILLTNFNLISSLL